MTARLFDDPRDMRTAPPPADAEEVSFDEPPEPSVETIELRGGLIARVDLLRALWRLEDAGVTVALTDAGFAFHPPSGATDADAALLRAHIGSAARLLAYVAPEMPR